MGYSYSLFRSQLKSDYIIEDLQCIGDEMKLEDCEFSIKEAKENRYDSKIMKPSMDIFGVVCKAEGICAILKS